MNWAVVDRDPRSDLDRQAFLNLLITQLRHQDPMNPMEDRDFIAQMAQFSALEQMMALNNTFERTQAFGMIGKTVEFGFFCDTRERWIEDVGFVESVTRRGDRTFLTVNGNDVPLDAVREVSEDVFMAYQMANILNRVQGQQANELIGRYIQAVIPGADGALEFVEGKVTSVRMASNGTFVVVNNREVDIRSVASVGTDYKIIGSSHFNHGTEACVVENVRITRLANNTSRVELQFTNGDRIEIQSIPVITAAVGFIGERMQLNSVAGVAQSITIRQGIPFMQVVDSGPDGNIYNQINFVDYLISRGMASGQGSTPETGTGNNTNNNNTDTPDADGDNG